MLKPGWRSDNALIVLTTLFILGFANQSFFSRVLAAYPPATGNVLFLLSLPLVIGAMFAATLGLFCFGRSTRPLLALFIVMAALVAYFMDSYGIVINSSMLRNALETNPDEVGDLLNMRLLTTLLLLAALPLFVLLRVRPSWPGWRAALVARVKLMLACVLLMVASGMLFGSHYASFLREHKALRAYVNPLYAMTSVARLVGEAFSDTVSGEIRAVGLDARTPAQDKHRELIILVLGETARADHFSLNGYARDTNPLMRAAGAVSFPDFRACDTSTATALPCIFQLPNAKGVGVEENLLDVLQHAGVNVLWRDNNSDSKGVAARVPYQSFKTPATNPVCDEECRDEGMLAGLQDYIDAHPKGDIFIVLHQMGNHGPAYYKRYPPAFEQFQPACRNKDLGQCSQAEIINAYDNALRYTDYFLSQVTEFLERNGKTFEAAMFYVSDHGESLGEGGVYLHGMPKAVAPHAQLHVPALMWFAKSYDEVDLPALRDSRQRKLSHENLFHTVLGFLEIRSGIYRPELDILSCCRSEDD